MKQEPFDRSKHVYHNEAFVELVKDAVRFFNGTLSLSPFLNHWPPKISYDFLALTARIASENPYHDRVEGNVLVYTATGRKGNQFVSGMNKRLVEQLDTPFPIYGFQNIGSRRDKKLGSRRWEFLGLLQYLRHYKETQIDSRGKARDALVFEMQVHREQNSVAPEFDFKIYSEVLREFQKTEKEDSGDRTIIDSSVTLSPKLRKIDGLEAERIRCTMLNLQPQRFEHLIKNVVHPRSVSLELWRL